MNVNVVYDSTDFHQPSRRVVANIKGSLSVAEFTEKLVSMLRLTVFDAHSAASIQYSLERLESNTGDFTPLEPAAGLANLVKSDDTLRLRPIASVNAISNVDYAIATFGLAGQWSVRDFQQLLAEVRTAYVNLFAQNELLSESKRIEHHPFEFRQLQSRHDAIAANLKTSEDLVIHRIQLASPGILEVLGAFNPLETIARYLKDRRQARIEERKQSSEEIKDASYRDALDKAKRVLEIESLKTHVARDRALFLRDVGFSQEEVRPYIDAVLQRPIEALAAYELGGRLEVPTITRIESSAKIEIVETRSDGRAHLLGS